MPAADHLRLIHNAGGQTAPMRQSSVRAVLDRVSPDASAEDVTLAVMTVLQPGADTYPLGRLGVVWAYVTRLGFWAVLDAAAIAEARIDDFDRRFAYFAGVCRRKLRQLEGDG